VLNYFNSEIGKKVRISLEVGRNKIKLWKQPGSSNVLSKELKNINQEEILES
jgi:hypothetical protein